MDCSTKSVWLPNIYRTCFWKRTDQVLSWYATLYVDIVEKGWNLRMELRQFTCISMAAAFGVVRLWVCTHLDMNKNKIIWISEFVILITVYSNISDLFQQHISNCRVTMATFYDDIVAGITSLVNYTLNCHFPENMAHFHNIWNDFLKWFQCNSFQLIYLI